MLSNTIWKDKPEIKRAILVVGYAGSGKDTVSAYIQGNYGYNATKLADPIKRIAQYLFGWKRHIHIEGAYKEKVDPMFGISPRAFLQHMGTDFMQHHLRLHFHEYGEKIGREFWVRYLTHTVSSANIVVSDVRFPHEVNYMRKHIKDTVVIKINRPVEGFWGNVKDGLKRLFEHSSEKDVSKIKADYVIDNVGSVTDLYEKVNKIMEVIK